MIRSLASIALTFAVLPISGWSGEAHRCILPEADFRDGASPPNLQGTVVAVIGRDLVLRPDNGRSQQRVRLDMQTKMFTSYGGAVLPGDLRDGQRVRVWFRRCAAPARGRRPVAAVIEFASKAPGEDFP